jgi:cysteine desulfurase/selenocysteine lyase
MSLLNLREEFPALSQRLELEGSPQLVYLDSAATTLKPRRVVDRILRYYELENSNVHRGLHYLSRRATEAFEGAREQVAEFIGAKADEIIFTKGTTESINLLAATLGSTLKPGDTVMLTEMEHHSNIVPWQLTAEKYGLNLKYISVNAEGDLVIPEKIPEDVALVAITGISNTLGTINDIQQVVSRAHAMGAKVVVDAAQWVSHAPINVKEVDCDFLAFSGHKLFGPMGIGVLYGKSELLKDLPPYQGGGAMIEKVEYERSTFLPPPFRFEAGTPHVAGVLGLAEAIAFVKELGWDAIVSHHEHITKAADEALSSLDGLTLFGRPKNRAPIFSFNLAGLHASDVSFLLDRYGVAVRAGHHCTQPLLQKFGLSATARASFSLYNNFEDINALVESLKKIKEMSQ